MILDISDGKLEEVKENTNRIKHQMKKLQSFVEELLNLARADLAEDKEAAVNLKSLVEEVTDNQKEIIARSGLLVTVDIPSSLCIQVTKISIFQILDNLVSNAAKYVNRETKHSTIKIICSENESGVLLEISDNGVGIPQEEHKNVGKLFKRFHPHLAYGSGLGLAIVYKHLRAINATIDFNSDNAGTSFRIQLPLEGTASKRACDASE